MRRRYPRGLGAGICAGGAIAGVDGVLISMFLTFSAASGVIFTMKA